MSINLVEASISDLQQALSTGSITSVELVAKYLQRISTYDCRGPCLNSIPILNQDIFTQAAASDARRASGQLLGALEGIPYTLKDSMKYKGMTCSTGSPAFDSLVANEDSFVAEQLRKAGVICIGRTNTPPMMASGMHRGVHGRAESPYNLDYLTAAFSSGSSNGSGTSTAASFAAFGLGSETVSSGRSPASNNGLVAYTPSRTMISPRGVWPLYPTCDVLVPHTRSVDDMLTILDVLTVVDHTTEGDFWREQQFVKIPPIPRPISFLDLKATAPGSLGGKQIAVPKMYIGKTDSKATNAPFVSPGVIALWNRARTDLESLGATVIETDFPLVTNYESDPGNNVQGFPPDWNCKERGELVVFAWDDFLKANADPTVPSLASADGEKMFPRPKEYIPDRYMEHKNFMNYPSLVEIAKNRKGKSIWDVDGIAEALPALEAQRKRDLEDWLDDNNLNFVVFPANGDVGRADLESNDESARHALQNGVKYSNGNRAIRHMGVPTVSVCMGMLESSKMPVNLTFAGKHGQDAELLKVAYEYEQARKRRTTPPVTPKLESDTIPLVSKPIKPIEPSFSISILSATILGGNDIHIEGYVASSSNEAIDIKAMIDGKDLPEIKTTKDNHFSITAAFTPYKPATPLYGGIGKVVNNVIVIILAKTTSQACYTSGGLVLVPQND